MMLPRLAICAAVLAALTTQSLALDLSNPETSTSFEFDDMSGSFLVGAAPHDILFTGGFTAVIGVPSIYMTGNHAWMTSPGGTSLLTARTPASELQFFVRTQNSATTGAVSVFATDGSTLASFVATNASWTLVSVSVAPGDPQILGASITHTGGAGVVAVEDLSYCSNVTGDSMCFGDGGDQMGCSDCPCMNEAPQGAGTGCLNSAGTASGLLGRGVPSVGADSLHFDLLGAPPSAFCILNSGDNIAPQGMGNPCFGLDSGILSSSFDGLRCAVGNTRRHGGRSADSNGQVGFTNNGWGPPNGPMAGFAAQSGFTAGQTRHFQVIHREDALAGCMRGLNTSQAVSITYLP